MQISRSHENVVRIVRDKPLHGILIGLDYRLARPDSVNSSSAKRKHSLVLYNSCVAAACIQWHIHQTKKQSVRNSAASINCT